MSTRESVPSPVNASTFTIALALYGSVFLMIGVISAVSTEFMVRTLALTPPVPAQALVELRATYGGVQIGFGLLYLMAALSPAMRPFAYLALIVFFVPIVACRSLGLVFDGGFTAFHALALAFEAGSVVFGLLGRRLDT